MRRSAARVESLPPENISTQVSLVTRFCVSMDSDMLADQFLILGRSNPRDGRRCPAVKSCSQYRAKACRWPQISFDAFREKSGATPPTFDISRIRSIDRSFLPISRRHRPATKSRNFGCKTSGIRSETVVPRGFSPSICRPPWEMSGHHPQFQCLRNRAVAPLIPSTDGWRNSLRSSALRFELCGQPARRPGHGVLPARG